MTPDTADRGEHDWDSSGVTMPWRSASGSLPKAMSKRRACWRADEVSWILSPVCHDSGGPSQRERQKEQRCSWITPSTSLNATVAHPMSLYGARLKRCPFVHTCVVSGLAGRRRRQRLQHPGFKDRRLLAAHSRARSTVVNCWALHTSVCRRCVSTFAAFATSSCERPTATTSRTPDKRHLRNPRDFVGYGEHCWGFTPFDAPGWCKRVVDAVELRHRSRAGRADDRELPD